MAGHALSDADWLLTMRPGCTEAEEEQFMERVSHILENDEDPFPEQVEFARNLALGDL